MCSKKIKYKFQGILERVNLLLLTNKLLNIDIFYRIEYWFNKKTKIKEIQNDYTLDTFMASQKFGVD